jgi:uncharacterized integral membrane protein
MISLVRLILLLTLLAILLPIGFLNVQQRVDVDLWLLGHFNRLPLALVMFYAYLAGLITFAFIHVLQVVKLRTQIARMNRENRRVQDELHQLRSITLEDLPLEESTQAS